VIFVDQLQEPAELVDVLGGQLVIRQGTRAHWTPENTTMHIVRAYDHIVFIDELDLTARNLCAGFSYCISVLNSVYVWHGCGSTQTERQAACRYALTLTSSVDNVTELSQGENDDDEMFWMILGDDGFANADYWKWRRTSSFILPRIWRVNADLGNKAVTAVRGFSTERASFPVSVYIVDCVWELFVVVGAQARHRRRDIRLAFNIAMELSTRVAPSRPHVPTVHVLIAPTRIPVDLRLHFRDLDEAALNNQEVPDHMNIVSSEDAMEHLRKSSWDKLSLTDPTMLPLGLGPSQIPA